jgi:hypothetical protein
LQKLKSQNQKLDPSAMYNIILGMINGIAHLHKQSK